VIFPFSSREDPDIDSVWVWFEFQNALIGESLAKILRFTSGVSVLGEALHSHEKQFTGLTRSEIEEFFDAQRSQLELLTMLELLTTTEAVLRIEVKTRVAERKKDPLSRRFRELNKRGR